MNRSSALMKLASGIVATVPPTLIRGLGGAGPLIPYYHLVSDREVPHVKHLYRYKSVTQFTADIEFLCRHYHPIALADVIDHVKTGARLPDRALLLTFDDGFREMSEIVAPLLRAKGIHATFFVNSAFIDNRELCYLNKGSLVVDRFLQRPTVSATKELTAALLRYGIRVRDVPTGVLAIAYSQRAAIDELAHVLELDFNEYLAVQRPYLTTDQTRGLIRSGFSIGAHSVDHPLYASLSLDEQLRQTTESLSVVRETFRLGYGAFAFPHSDRLVSKAFFDRLSETGLMDVSFGTAGMVRDSVATHLQRFSLEAPVEPARRIVAFQQVRRCVKALAGSATVRRQ